MPSRPSFNTFAPIVGRATLVALSLDYDRHYAPRWDRFGYRLP